jgi:CBS domain-containing protein
MLGLAVDPPDGISIEPPAFGSGIFALTMKGLETGLKVGDIATYGFSCCDAEDDAVAVLGRSDVCRFDWIPVKDRERIVGVIQRSPDITPGTALARMRPLDDGMLVSSEESLKGFIPLLVVTPYRLVLRGARIEGIVTRSDVHKLPVRLLAFAVVTHLEMTMADLILKRSDGDKWTKHLSKTRYSKVKEKIQQLRRQQYDPPLIEVTEFCDKRDVLIRMGVLDTPSGRDFKRIEQLRNSVAHAATYAQNEEHLAEFVKLLALAEEWIERLSQNGGRDPLL